MARHRGRGGDRGPAYGPDQLRPAPAGAPQCLERGRCRCRGRPPRTRRPRDRPRAGVVRGRRPSARGHRGAAAASSSSTTTPTTPRRSARPSLRCASATAVGVSGRSTNPSRITAPRRCWSRWRMRLRPLTRSSSPTSGRGAIPIRRSRAPPPSLEPWRRGPGTTSPRLATPRRPPGYLATQVRSDDIVLVMGGGRSYVIARDLVESLSSADHG